MKRFCTYQHDDGRSCSAPPLRDEPYCLFHSPGHTAEVAEGRRLGGLHRRREVVVQTAYDIDRLTTLAGIERLVEIAIHDALNLQPSPIRCRILLQAAHQITQLIEVSDQENRIAALERATGRPVAQPRQPFDTDDAEADDESDQAGMGDESNDRSRPSGEPA
jgi:hypothetical protein